MNRGFTLAEAMIVFVILVILAAIIVPQFFSDTSKDSKNDQTSKDVQSVNPPAPTEEAPAPELAE